MAPAVAPARTGETLANSGPVAVFQKRPCVQRTAPSGFAGSMLQRFACPLPPCDYLRASVPSSDRGFCGQHPRRCRPPLPAPALKPDVVRP